MIICAFIVQKVLIDYQDQQQQRVRKEIGEALLKDLQIFAQRSKVPDAIRVAEYLRDNHYYATPASDINGSPIFLTEHNKPTPESVGLMIILENDRSISSWWAKLIRDDAEKGTCAEYSGVNNTIRIYGTGRFSKNNTLLILLHEGLHAYYHNVLRMRVPDDGIHCEYEVPAYSLMSRVLNSLGGERYTNAVKANAQRIQHEVDAGIPHHMRNGWMLPDYSKPTTNIEFILGPRAGKDDSLMHTNLFWFDTMYELLEKIGGRNADEYMGQYLCEGYLVK